MSYFIYILSLIVSSEWRE